MEINTVIWDFGGVLIDWDPRYLYRKVFYTDHAVEHFLNYICTPDWNEEQDAGRSFEEGTRFLINLYPQYSKEIKMFYDRWEEMLGGPVAENVEILKNMKDRGDIRLIGLTNWSAESFPIALQKYEFLHWFDGILVSGIEGIRKPDPEIYELVVSRYKIDKRSAIFIDDNKRNIIAAQQQNISSLHFQNSQQLKAALKLAGIL